MSVTVSIFATGQDGSVRNAATGSTQPQWKTLKDASTGTSVAYTADDNTTFVEAVNGGWGDGKQYIDRGFLAFIDSVIPSGAIISAASINLYVTTKNTGSGGSVTVVSGSQSGTSSLATSDYSACGTTEFVASRTNFTSLTTSAYNTFTLNSSGISNITVGGTSKFCFRSSFDLDETNPTASTLSYFTIATTEHTGTSQDPYLSVTYYLEKSYTADAVIVPPSATQTYTADADISSNRTTKTFTADAVIARTSIAADGFLEAGGSNVNLSSHTPSGAAATGTWSSHPASTISSVVAGSSGRYAFQSTGTSIDLLSATPPSADYEVEATVTVMATAYSCGVLARWDTSAATGYSVVIDGGGIGTAGYLRLEKHVAGTFTQDVGTPYNIGTLTGPYRIGIRCSGSTISAYLDGVQRISVTDTSISAAGKAGIRNTGTGASSGFRLSNFGVFSGFTSTNTQTFTADAVVADHTATKTYTADAIVLGTTTKTYTADAEVATRITATSVSQSGAAQTVVSDTGASDSLNYNSFPGLCRMPNGNLLLAYHAANDHTGSTSCKIKVNIGTPDGSGGYTWGSATTLYTSSGTNLCDVGCITLANGDVMVTWNDSSTPGHATINTVVNFRYRKSSDNGSTWASTVSQAVPGWATTVTAGSPGGAYALAPCKPVQIPTGNPNAGRLLLATYGWDNRAIEDGGGSFSSHEYVKCCYSDDNGATWAVLSTLFPDTAGTAYDETDLLILSDGAVIAACRQITGTGTGYNIITRRSGDGGATWDTATIALGTSTTTGYGGRPDLVETANGGVLLRFRYMYVNQSSWSGYRLSLDRGATFTAPDIDPYDGTTGRTGLYTGSGRGPDVYGAFALTAAGASTVAYAWSEETNPGTGTRSIIYFRVLSVVALTTKTYTADAIVSASGSSSQTKTYTADAVIYAPPYSVSYTADGIVKGLGLTLAYTADAALVDSASQSTALSWFFRRRRSSMTPQTKTYTVVQPKGTTKTATWTSPTYQSKTEAGILVVLDVTSASGTGGLTLRINAQDSAGSVSVPLNSAPTTVTAAGTTSYALYPFGAISGALTQSTSGYLPREFSISVTHGDSSSYTYSVGYCLLP